MARPGGEADKVGNLFEGAWTIHHQLLVLHGRGKAITVEDLGERGEGSEFTFTTVSGDDEAHQVKRRTGANGWSLRDLAAKGVLSAAGGHVQAGRQFHFVSNIPAPDLRGLADFGRRSKSVDALRDEWLQTDKLRERFEYLSSAEVYGSERLAWQTLRGIWVHCQDEDGLRRMNEALAALVLDGASPAAAALSLGDLAHRHLGVKLDATTIDKHLGEYGLRRVQLVGNPDISRAVAQVAASWKASVERELLRPAIPRVEAVERAEALRTGSQRVAVVVGAAGGGKSAVLYQAVQELEAQGWPVLSLRLDRLESFSSTADLGRRLDLGRSPVAALAAVAGDGPSLLVIDQVDAVSLVSGRLPRGFDAVADLIREAAAFPHMRLLLACRAFDVDNDHRIRNLVSEQTVKRIDVHPLSAEQVDAAVRGMGLPAEQLTPTQRSLLSSPFNLVLLTAIADQADALSFTSDGGLLNAYWERKRRDCTARRPTERAPRFAAVIGTLANAMSEQQRLTAPITVLDADDLAGDAEVLASEHLVVQDGRRYAFFHEAFFDYAFARLWINRGQTLVEFLLSGEQELFRRAQVRQIMYHIRNEDADRFVREAEAVLAAQKIRFHIKAVVLAVLRSLPDPSAAEWHMIERLMPAAGPLEAHLWGLLRTLPWFDRLDAEGAFVRWLASGDETTYGHAMEAIVGGVKQRPDRIAELIAPYVGTPAPYLNWLVWVTRFAAVHDSRPLFDLILQAVRRGDYNDREQALWDSLYGLGQHQPPWAVELLQAWLVERPGALDRDASGQVTALRSREHNLLDLVSNGAQRASEEYATRLVPYLLTVMAATETDPGRQPIRDRQFSLRQPQPGPLPDLDDTLLHGAVTALRSLIAQNPTAAQPILELLARDAHDAAQWLLYEALSSAGERYADWAAELLLQGAHRLPSGHISDAYASTQQLIEATSPHMSNDHFHDLEALLLKYRPEWEVRRSAGWSSFELLSAMDESRLSEQAKRHLGELRRRFNTDKPPARPAFTGGFIGSPIPESAAQHMNDDQWWGAIKKYDHDRTDFTTLRGGVHQLSHVLQMQATSDPARFSRLARQLTDNMHPAYANAILQAFGQTNEDIDPALVFDTMRHIAAFNNTDNDQSLSIALRRQLDSEIPDDIIDLILDRALHAADPVEDAWNKEASDGKLYYGGDIYGNGINTARGDAVLILGDLIIHDTDGQRTRRVAPKLNQLAQDPSLAVRSCVAHLLAACLRNAGEATRTAYDLLIQADDRLLATSPVADLTIRVGLSEPTRIDPVIQRMLAAADAHVREVGGQLAAYAGLELGLGHLLATAQDSADAATRKGVAATCAHTLTYTSDAAATTAALCRFVTDNDEQVRAAAAQVASELRDHRLQPFREVLTALMASEAYAEALPQLLFTLRHAPDRVDDLVAHCTQRFIEIHGTDASNIATSAAGDARYVTQLIVRAYAQAPDATARKHTLDLIDQLLLIDAVGALVIVDEAEREARQ